MRDLVPIDIISDFSCDSVNWVVVSYIYDALRDLVPFIQFKKREKHPWKSVTLHVL